MSDEWRHIHDGGCPDCGITNPSEWYCFECVARLKAELAHLKNHLGGWHGCDGDCGNQRWDDFEERAVKPAARKKGGGPG